MKVWVLLADWDCDGKPEINSIYATLELAIQSAEEIARFHQAKRSHGLTWSGQWVGLEIREYEVEVESEGGGA